jgi:hypothetical protein
LRFGHCCHIAAQWVDEGLIHRLWALSFFLLQSWASYKAALKNVAPREQRYDLDRMYAGL